MPKVKRKLTELEIKKATPKDKAYKVYDEGGMMLLVRPSGIQVWQYPYKHNGKYNVYTIGRQDIIGSAEARRRLIEIKELLKQGIDPNQKKKDDANNKIDKNLNTFEALGRQWYAKQTWKPKHAKNIMSRLEKDVFNNIGRKPITDITVKDIIIILKKIEERGAPDVAKRVNQYCTAIFDYAINMGICENNPALGRSKFVKSYKTKNRDHLKEDEIPDFMKALEEANQLSISVLAAKLLSLTFVRPYELRFARWEEINEKDATWTIPAERMLKNGREFVIPLSKQALEVIGQIKKISGNHEILFPGQKRITQPISDVAVIKAVKNLTNKKSTPHGFRHTASTILNEKGFNHDHIERQLDHIDKNKVRGTYNKAKYLKERTKMMQFWADFLDRKTYGKCNVVEGKFSG